MDRNLFENYLISKIKNRKQVGRNILVVNYFHSIRHVKFPLFIIGMYFTKIMYNLHTQEPIRHGNEKFKTCTKHGNVTFLTNISLHSHKYFEIPFYQASPKGLGLKGEGSSNP